MGRKIISLILVLSLLSIQAGLAEVGQLNLANYLSQGPKTFTPLGFQPPVLRYFSYDASADNFQLLLDPQDLKDKLSEDQTKSLAQEQLNYFMVGLTLPNSKFWVNLRPDAPDNIIEPELEQTEVGRIMLESDLQLKKDTALFTSPQTKEGRVYWDKLYQKAKELFGTEPANIPTITRPWIVPGEILIREDQGAAYVYKATLKVMLEEDYLERTENRLQRTDYSFKDSRMKELNVYSSQLIRELILPKLTQEVNSGKNYGSLRQVYFSLVLSRWFKARFGSQKTEDRGQKTEQAKLSQLIDSGKLEGLTSKQPWSKETYFKEYQKSFAQGEYNLKEQVSTPTGQVIRSYVSGGVNATGSDNTFRINNRFSGYGSTDYLTGLFFGGSKGIVSASPLTKTERTIIERGGTLRKLVRDGMKVVVGTEGKPQENLELIAGDKLPLQLSKQVDDKIKIERNPQDPHNGKMEMEVQKYDPVSDLVTSYFWKTSGKIFSSDRYYLVEREGENVYVKGVVDFMDNIKYGRLAGIIGLTEQLKIELLINTMQVWLATQPVKPLQIFNMFDPNHGELYLVAWLIALSNLQTGGDIIKKSQECEGCKEPYSYYGNLKVVDMSGDVVINPEQVKQIIQNWQDYKHKLGSSPLTPEKIKAAVDTAVNEMLQDSTQRNRLEVTEGAGGALVGSYGYVGASRIGILGDLGMLLPGFNQRISKEEISKWIRYFIHEVETHFTKTGAYSYPEKEVIEIIANCYLLIGHEGTESGPFEFFPGELDVDKLRNALKKNRLADQIVLQELGLSIDKVDTVSERALLQAFNKILNTRDFANNISIDEYKSNPSIAKHLLYRDRRFSFNLDNIDYLRLNRALLELIYPVETRKTPRSYYAHLPDGLAKKLFARTKELLKASSAVVQQKIAEKEVGGIDFTDIEKYLQYDGNFKGIDLSLPLLSKKELESIDLEKEEQTLRNYLATGFNPNGDRLKRLLAGLFQKEEFSSRQLDLLRLSQNLCNFLSARGMETTPDQRAFILITDTGLFLKQGAGKASIKPSLN